MSFQSSSGVTGLSDVTDLNILYDSLYKLNAMQGYRVKDIKIVSDLEFNNKLKSNRVLEFLVKQLNDLKKT